MSTVAGAAVVWSAPVVRSIRLERAAGTPAPETTTTVEVVEPPTDPPTEPTTSPPTTSTPSEPPAGCRAELSLKGAYNLQATYDLDALTLVPEHGAPMSVGARNAPDSGRFELLMARVSHSEHAAFKGALGIDLADGTPMTFRISGHWDDDATTFQGSAVAAKGASLKLRFVCS